VEDVILKQLKQLAENGFEQSDVEAAMNRWGAIAILPFFFGDN
jgi:hypothetical protein